MKKLFIEVFFITPLAILLFLPLSVIGVIYTFIKHIIKFDYKLDKQLFPIVRSFNLVLDSFANACSGELWNDIFKVSGKIKYGKWYQTISAVTGIRYVYEGKDTWLRRLLDKLDKDHCKRAITPEDNYFYSKNG